MKKFRYLLTVAVASLSLAGCDFIQIVDSDSDSSEAEVVVDPVVIDEYYKGYKLTASGGRLALELQQNCFDKHKNYITYGQVNSYYVTNSSHDSAEAVAPGSKKNQWFYTGKEATGTGTREHVWPCANSSQLWIHDDSAGVHYVDYSYYVGGGSDLYHVRTANSAVNTARGNSKFVDFSDPAFDAIRSGVEEVGESNGKYVIKIQGHSRTASGQIQYAQKCEPADEMKGDIARIITYVWVHYTERGITPSGSITSGKNQYKYSDMTGQLSLTNIMGYESVAKCKEVLKAWNKLDPPSNVEKHRNDTVQKIQGNRNPFVDYPDLMDQLFIEE